MERKNSKKIYKCYICEKEMIEKFYKKDGEEKKYLACPDDCKNKEQKYEKYCEFLMGFGKYKDRKMIDVIKEDEKYIIFIMKKFDKNSSKYKAIKYLSDEYIQRNTKKLM